MGVGRWTLDVGSDLIMRVIIINTGTEILLGNVVNAHLDFVAREIFGLGLRVDEQRTVPDGEAIRHALSDVFPRCEILIVTGGLGPTSDDITRDIVAETLGLKLHQDPQLLALLQKRIEVRKIRWTTSIARQADVPDGAQVLANEFGSAPGLYLKANVNSRIPSPHLFVLPGPPRELQPMFRTEALPLLRDIVSGADSFDCRIYRITGIGESLVEEAIGEKLLAIPGLELGYCARPGDVDVRVVGARDVLEKADAIITPAIGDSIYSTTGEDIEEVVVKLLKDQGATVSVAESCTGGLLANRFTNVPGASDVFIAGYVTYSNAAKVDSLSVDPKLVDKHGAVSEPVARAMADGALSRSGSKYALATTGVAGPGGGSAEKPVGTLHLALASADSDTVSKKLFFPSDRETFKNLATQAGLDLLRRKLLRA